MERVISKNTFKNDLERPKFNRFFILYLQIVTPRIYIEIEVIFMLKKIGNHSLMQLGQYTHIKNKKNVYLRHIFDEIIFFSLLS